MRVLVCGDRWYDDRLAVRRVLDGLHREAKDRERHYEHIDLTCTCLTVIEGECQRYDKDKRETVGADWFAREWAERNRVAFEPYEADWDEHGRAAGPIRNQRMLDEGKPDVGYAFHDDLATSKGTADMVRRLRKAGVPVYIVSRAT